MADTDFVFDTSAIFAFAENEAGADRIEQLLNTAKKGECKIHASFVSLAEAYYIAWQETGRSRAIELIAHIKALPVSIVESNERLSLMAGSIKATHRLSFADSFVAATTALIHGTLVHKDPEFEQLAGFIELEHLPYKLKKRGLSRK